jgi:hypothetical protein
LLAIENQEEREELTRWHIGKLQYVYASRIQTDHQFLIDQHYRFSSTSRGGSGGGRIRMINAQKDQIMEYIHDSDFRIFTLVEAELQQPQGAIFLAKMTTIKAVVATIEAAAVAAMVFSKI